MPTLSSFLGEWVVNYGMDCSCSCPLFYDQYRAACSRTLHFKRERGTRSAAVQCHLHQVVDEFGECFDAYAPPRCPLACANMLVVRSASSTACFRGAARIKGLVAFATGTNCLYLTTPLATCRRRFSLNIVKQTTLILQSILLAYYF